jgi:hypothetical protein
LLCGRLRENPRERVENLELPGITVLAGYSGSAGRHDPG